MIAKRAGRLRVPNRNLPADPLADYDPDTIDVLPIKYALGRIPARRNAARARLAKTKP